jgi:osmotically-inducible protein OsmY
MQLLKLLVKGISVSTVAILGLGACNPPNTSQTTVPSTSAPTTATGNTTAPTASAPATTTAQTVQNQDIDDIAERVEDALKADSTLNLFDLDADDRGNSIVLTGRVQTAEQKALAEQIARQIAPNVSIDNQTVASTSAPPTATGNTTAPTPAAPATTTAQTAQNQDLDDIVDRVEDALKADSTLNLFDLDADDRGNSIVLTGRVQTAEQKALAEQIARQTAPNISLNNQIVVQ